MNSVEDLPKTTFSARRFTRKQLAQVQETVETFKNLSRKELAQTVCEHLGWKNAGGANKLDSCLKMLEEIEANGLIVLPQKRCADVAPKHRVDIELAEHGPAIDASLDDLAPVALELVESSQQRETLKASIQAHHYLGYRHVVGSQLGYFIVSRRNGRRLGCLLFSSSAVWNLPARDQFIGWDKKHREKFLHLVLTQNRFLIFPWINVPNLASHILSLSEKQVATDWVKIYGYRPVMIETFVDNTRFSGACYKASNWQFLGRTKSRNSKTAKDIYVRPLVNDVQRSLTEGSQMREIKKRYRNDVKLSGTHRPDENFIALWKKIPGLMQEVADEYDKKWRIRERVINTLILMLLIFRMVTSKNNQSYGTTIDELWDTCGELDIPLPQKASIAPSSLCDARKKLDENVFINLNKKIIETYSNYDTDRFLWNGHRVFAVDGSKLNLPRNLQRFGYALPSDNAYYPQGLLSCLYELKSQLPIDFDLVSHGDERRCALRHLRALKANDIVVYDRGYFSYIMLHHHCEASIHAVFRLQESSTSAVNEFWNSNKVDSIVTLYPSSRTLADITKAHPGIQIVPRKIRLIKYQIESTTFCLGTTLVGECEEHKIIPLHDLAELYHARWGVEELYKVSKRIFVIENFHAKYERGVKQELFAHFVLITLNRLFANQIDLDLNSADEANSSLKPLPSAPSAPSVLRRLKTNFKNCVHVIAHHLEPLFLLHNKTIHAVKTAYKFIVKQHQRVRPNRSYPRKSMRPESKWRPSKKKVTTQNPAGFPV